MRGELHHRLLDAGILEPPDWWTLTVEGLQQFADEHGREWFGYRASLWA